MTEGGKGRWMSQGWNIAEQRKRKVTEGEKWYNAERRKGKGG
jgi:hypothetical protein